MAYNTELAARVRQYLVDSEKLPVIEKKMFGGLAFLVNDKMCINVSGDRLMCRIDPSLTEEVLKRVGVSRMVMKGKELNGYCYVEPIGFKSKKDFEFWADLCLQFNRKAASSKRK